MGKTKKESCRCNEISTEIYQCKRCGKTCCASCASKEADGEYYHEENKYSHLCDIEIYASGS